jgi:hypothetical protein
VFRGDGKSKQAAAAFAIKSWDEKAVWEDNGQKVTRANVVKAYSGALEGRGDVEYTMFYTDGGTARYVGVERVTASLGGRAGSFAFEHQGTFAKGVATSVWNVIGGSGTGELSGLRGRVESAVGHAETYGFEMEYELA